MKDNPPTEVVRQALRAVIDPELGLNIVDLGLIYAIDWPAENQVRVEMTMTMPACPATEYLERSVREALLMLDDIEHVHVQLVWSPPWTPERISAEGKRLLGIS